MEELEGRSRGGRQVEVDEVDGSDGAAVACGLGQAAEPSSNGVRRGGRGVITMRSGRSLVCLGGIQCTVPLEFALRANAVPNKIESCTAPFAIEGSNAFLTYLVEGTKVQDVSELELPSQRTGRSLAAGGKDAKVADGDSLSRRCANVLHL